MDMDIYGFRRKERKEFSRRHYHPYRRHISSGHLFSSGFDEKSFTPNDGFSKEVGEDLILQSVGKDLTPQSVVAKDFTLQCDRVEELTLRSVVAKDLYLSDSDDESTAPIDEVEDLSRENVVVENSTTQKCVVAKDLTKQNVQEFSSLQSVVEDDIPKSVLDEDLYLSNSDDEDELKDFSAQNYVTEDSTLQCDVAQDSNLQSVISKDNIRTSVIEEDLYMSDEDELISFSDQNFVAEDSTFESVLTQDSNLQKVVGKYVISTSVLQDDLYTSDSDDERSALTDEATDFSHQNLVAKDLTLQCVIAQDSTFHSVVSQDSILQSVVEKNVILQGVLAEDLYVSDSEDEVEELSLQCDREEEFNLSTVAKDLYLSDSDDESTAKV